MWVVVHLLVWGVLVLLSLLRRVTKRTVCLVSGAKTQLLDVLSASLLKVFQNFYFETLGKVFVVRRGKSVEVAYVNTRSILVRIIFAMIAYLEKVVLLVIKRSFRSNAAYDYYRDVRPSGKYWETFVTLWLEWKRKEMESIGSSKYYC